MLGYTDEDIEKMMRAIETAYEIIDGPAEVESGLEMALDFFDGLIAEGLV